MVFVKSEGSPLLPGPGGYVSKTRGLKWTAAAVLLCACVIVASVVSFKPAVDAIKAQQQMSELMSLGSLDGGSTRNVNINIIRGGGAGDGGQAPAPSPPSPAQTARNAAQQVDDLQAHVAEQMAHADHELQAQKQRAADLVKANVRLFH